MTTPVLATFIDSTAPARIQFDGSFTGAIAYADGLYEWSVQEIDRFLAAEIHLYRISVLGGNVRKASLVDCEKGDVTPAQAARYVKDRNDVHGDGGFYADRVNVPAVVAELGSEPAWLWCADWTGSPHVPSLDLPPNIHLALVQYANLPTRNRDMNAVYSQVWLGDRHPAS